MDRDVLLQHIHWQNAPDATGNVEGMVRSLQALSAAHPSALHYRLLLAEALMLIRPDEAIPHFVRVVRAGRTEPHAYWHLATLLMADGRRADALNVCEIGLRHYPNDLDILSKTAFLGRHNEFVEYALKRLAAEPGNAKLWSQLGLVLRELGSLAEAEVCLRRECELDPNTKEGHLQLAFTLLLNGNFAEGWLHYERRWNAVPKAKHPVMRCPMWNGSPLAGKRILLWAEQGIGDSIQYARYVREVKERGGVATLRVPETLKRLMGWLADAPEIVSDSVGFDLHCPLLTLPLLSGTRLDSVPPPASFIIPDDASRKWAERLNNQPGLKVAISWAGNPLHLNDQARSASLSDFRPLLDVPDCRFFSLQIGTPSRQLQEAELSDRVQDLKHHIQTDIAEAAAALAQMDLVITIDSAIAHLAGSLGIPTWILLPFAPDWRWLLGRSDSPWYPTVRLFRQKTAFHWHDVIQEVAKELAAVAASYNVVRGTWL